jgi:acyl-CoA reductase-like NAD-dependent aldehyde dehydrogenase
MSERLPIAKTFKLYINGAFPRSESGRSEPILSRDGRVLGHSCLASRKDLREAVGAARKALSPWSKATAYNRAQILYRMGEMLEAKRHEFVALLREGASAGLSEADAARQLDASVDRLVAYAGWADKFAQVLGCQNPVAGPYWNITTPEPTGVVGVLVGASAPSLLGAVSLLAPVVCAGNTCVLIADGSGTNPAIISTLGEVMATSDLPGGVVNLLTGSLDELVPVLAKHRDVDGAHAAELAPALRVALGEGTADNLKRVTHRADVDWLDAVACESAWWIEPFVEFKTAWHPVGS